MGGDDLASDDEYLFDANLVDTSNGRGTAISSDDENGSISGDDNNDGEALPSSLVSLIKKRKKGQENNNANASDDDDELKSKKKRKRKEKVPTTSKGLLIQAGRGIAVDSADAQATFMNTIYSHAMKLAEGAAKPAENENDKDNNEGAEVEESETTPTTATTTSFSFEPHIYSPKTTPSSETLKFQHNNLDAFLKSGPLPSNKRLKNWKHPQSPMVLVVTLSARRSVELMKQLSSLKLPIAKLFAKHMSVEDQVELLKGVGGKSAAAAAAGGNGNGGGMGRGGGKKTKCYSLAVGTPGRLLKLLRHERDEPNSGGVGALKLRHTEVVIIDCHEDSKGWTVCTLNDTSKELMEFMKEGLVPEMERRKGKIKLAMF